jgi:CHRD domain
MDKHIVVAAFVVAGIAAAATAHADELFQARLSGDQEVPPVATDTAGRAQVLVSKDRNSAEYTLRVENGVRVTQSHFHCAPAGVNGPIIVFLAGFHAPGWDVDGKWVDNATVTDANIVNPACGTTLAAIFEQARAGNVYVNVHSVAHPGGEARGQLLPTGN